MVYECGLRLAARFKSGGPSLGRSPGAHKQRQPVNQDQIQIFGEIGSTQFSEQGFAPCSFFFWSRLALCSGFSKCFERTLSPCAKFLGAEWSPELEDAWRKLLGELDRVVTQSEA